jgi:phospholipase C
MVVYLGRIQDATTKKSVKALYCMNRRHFLKNSFGAGAALGFSSGRSFAQSSNAQRTVAGVPTLSGDRIFITDQVNLPPPRESGIEHVVVVMMENRSLDHLLGWLPGADGRQEGLTYFDKQGNPQSTYPLAPDYTGCGHHDPEHFYAEDRVAYNGGAMDGFLLAGDNDLFSIGYYTEADLPFYSALARNYTAFDRYFAAALAPTFPNRLFFWAGQTDRLDDSTDFTNVPTIFDRLRAAGVSHQYYFNNLPFTSLWGFRYFFATSPYSDFLNAAASGKLPAVSFVDPAYTILDDGSGTDDHPHADIRNGDAFLAEVYQALARGPAWPKTVLIITFDEWGGFFDHVPPPRVVAPNNVDQDLIDGKALLGMRVPLIIASPFTRNSEPDPRVNSAVFDHASILKLIEWRWGLRPLTARDASDDIGNLAIAMNFTSPDTNLPLLPIPASVNAPGCFESGLFGQLGASKSAEPRTSRSESGWAALAKTPVARQWLTYRRN